jgi:hypothetical protein
VRLESHPRATPVAPPRWRVFPFILGVASGQPQPGSVVLWTRLRIDDADAARREQAAEVVCELFADEALRQPVRQWRLSADARRGHSLHVLADGLSQLDGNGVTDMSHGMGSRATKLIIIREGLNACAFANGHVTQTAISEANHGFAPAHSVDPSLNRF